MQAHTVDVSHSDGRFFWEIFFSPEGEAQG
jgi:hypothetical protein